MILDQAREGSNEVVHGRGSEGTCTENDGRNRWIERDERRHRFSSQVAWIVPQEKASM